MKTTKTKTQTQEAAAATLPKRKPGRPPKTDRIGAASPDGAKPAAAKRTRRTTKRGRTSTRYLIVAGANEIINRTGVVDFRIEMLAQALSLSPGNITYHFPKKEDIITAIWEEYTAVMQEMTEEMITSLLDIKQLFLYFRTAASKAIGYAGVTSYYFGDMGALLREHATFRDQIEHYRNEIFAGYDTLVRNGYMNPIEDPKIKELTFDSQMTMLRWWVDHAMTQYPEQDLPMATDKYIALSLLQLLPYLTEAGQRQFASIVNLIK